MVCCSRMAWGGSWTRQTLIINSSQHNLPFGPGKPGSPATPVRDKRKMLITDDSKGLNYCKSLSSGSWPSVFPKWTGEAVVNGAKPWCFVSAPAEGSLWGPACSSNQQHLSGTAGQLLLLLLDSCLCLSDFCCFCWFSVLSLWSVRFQTIAGVSMCPVSISSCGVLLMSWVLLTGKYVHIQHAKGSFPSCSVCQCSVPRWCHVLGAGNGMICFLTLHHVYECFLMHGSTVLSYAALFSAWVYEQREIK